MVSRSQEGFSPDGVGVIVLVAQQGVLVTLTVGDAVVLIGLEVVGTGELHRSSEVDQHSANCAACCVHCSVRYNSVRY